MIKFKPDPRHLLACCAVIALERLGWYTLMAALVFYLPRVGASAENAARAPGYLYALAYSLPLVGARLADRGLGYRRAALLGIALFAAGYTALALSMPLLGLLIVAAGNGLFKPSISALVGNAYLAGDSARDRAFATFYRSINIGSLPAGIIGGWLIAESASPLRFLWLAAGSCAAAAVLLANWSVLRAGEWRDDVEAMVQTQVELKDPDPPRPLWPLAALLCGAVVFWSAYNQSNSALVLWARDSVDRFVFGRAIPASWFSTLNPIYIIALGGPVEWLSKRLPLADRLLVGMAALVGSFLVLAASGPNPLWLVLAYGLLSFAELLISASCLAAVSSWVQRRKSAQALAAWFVTIALGGVLSGEMSAAADLRTAFGWTAAFCAAGFCWFFYNRRRFLAHEQLVRAAEIAA